jgi:hypothetical protein
VKLEANKRKELCKKEREQKQRKDSEPRSGTEAEFLDVIGTEVLRVLLLAIHSHFYYPAAQKWFESKQCLRKPQV